MQITLTKISSFLSTSQKVNLCTRRLHSFAQDFHPNFLIRKNASKSRKSLKWEAAFIVIFSNSSCECLVISQETDHPSSRELVRVLKLWRRIKCEVWEELSFFLPTFWKKIFKNSCTRDEIFPSSSLKRNRQINPPPPSCWIFQLGRHQQVEVVYIFFFFKTRQQTGSTR